MKKTILTLAILSAIGISNADYVLKYPLEVSNGGVLPNNSISFKHFGDWKPHTSIISEWFNVGYSYDCLNWYPLENTIPIGTKIIQTANDCKQKQERTIQNQEINLSGEIRTVGTIITETQTIIVSETRETDGTANYWEIFANSKNPVLDKNWDNLNWSLSSLTNIPTEPYPLSDVSNLYFYQNQINNVSGLISLKSVSGNLNLHTNQLTNVNGLNNLTSVGGYLNMFGNNLTNVDGLSSLKTVGGYIHLYTNNLTNVDGLSNLTSVGGNLNLHTNQLTNVNGLSSLTNIAGDFNLYNNKLTNVDGLFNLNSVAGYLYMFQNNLINVDGLSSLTSVGSNLNLHTNQLTNVNGLSSLTSVGGYFNLYNNKLTNVDGLSNLTSVGGYLHIYQNPNLTNLNGLRNVKVTGDIAIDKTYKGTKLAANTIFCTQNAAARFMSGYAQKTLICAN